MKELGAEELLELDGGSDFDWGSFTRGLACGALMVAGAGTGIGILVAVTGCLALT